jgi:hypothetical protein
MDTPSFPRGQVSSELAIFNVRSMNANSNLVKGLTDVPAVRSAES